MRSRTAGVMTTLMRNGRDRRSENPSGPTRVLERVLLFGTDQRITSGPAATAAASRQRQSSKRKQAGYMAAPERFAETSDSSCTAGAVHTWPRITPSCALLYRWGQAVHCSVRGEEEVLTKPLADANPAQIATRPPARRSAPGARLHSPHGWHPPTLSPPTTPTMNSYAHYRKFHRGERCRQRRPTPISAYHARPGALRICSRCELSSAGVDRGVQRVRDLEDDFRLHRHPDATQRLLFAQGIEWKFALSRCGHVPMTSSIHSRHSRRRVASRSRHSGNRRRTDNRPDRLKFSEESTVCTPSDSTTRLRQKVSLFRYHPGCCLRRLIDLAVRQRAAYNRQLLSRIDKLRNDLPSEVLTHSACSSGSIAAGTYSTHSNCGNLIGSSRNIQSGCCPPACSLPPRGSCRRRRANPKISGRSSVDAKILSRRAGEIARASTRLNSNSTSLIRSLLPEDAVGPASNFLRSGARTIARMKRSLNCRGHGSLVAIEIRWSLPGHRLFAGNRVHLQ